MIGDDTLFVINVDPDLIALDFDRVLVGGELFRLGSNLKAKMPVAFACKLKVVAQLTADFAVTLIELGELLLERAQRLLFLAVGCGNRLLDDRGIPAQFANQFDDNLFEWTGWDAAERAIRMLSVPVHASALVIKVLLAVGVLFAAGMRNQAVAAMSAMGKPFERGLMLVALPNGGRGFEFSLVQGLVGFIPKLGGNNARMFAGVFLIAVANHALVERVGDQLLDFIGTEAFAADLLFAAPRLVNTLAGAGSFVVDLLGNHGGVAPFSGQRVNALNQRGLVLIRVEFLGLRVVVVAEGDGSPGPFAALGAFGQFVRDTLGGQLALVLPEAE
nr:hypothetical protein [Cerasicoccus frondis]